jgi:hypothetical protein
MNYILFFFVVLIVVIFILVTALLTTSTSGQTNFDTLNVKGRLTAGSIVTDEGTIEDLTSTSITADSIAVDSLTSRTTTVSDSLTVTGSAEFDAIHAKSLVLNGDNLAVLDASSSTGSILLPKGSSSQRPSPPMPAMTRYNTTLNTVEWYTPSGWSSSSGFSPIITDPVAGQLLYYNGTTWVNGLPVNPPDISADFRDNIASATPFVSFLNIPPDLRTAEWQIWTHPPGTTSTLVFSSGQIPYTNTYDFNPAVSVTSATLYNVRVRYGVLGQGLSSWSDFQTVMSTPVITTPTITNIPDGNAVATTFETTVSGLTVNYARWQLYDSSNTLVYDSLATAGPSNTFDYKTHVTLTPDETYSARMLYVPDSTIYPPSAWSPQISFVHNSIAFSPPSGAILPPVMYNVPYSTTITMSGGTGTYTTIFLGTLPLGISFSYGGADDNIITISGTPTEQPSTPTNYSLTFSTSTVSDSGSANYTLPQTPTLAITFPGGSPVTPAYNTDYKQIITVTGGTAPYHDVGSILPAGLSIDPTTGELIIGRAMVTGNQTIQVKLADSNGVVGSSEPFVVDIFPNLNIDISNITSFGAVTDNIFEISTRVMTNYTNEPGVFFYPNSFLLPDGFLDARLYAILQNGQTDIIFSCNGVPGTTATITVPSVVEAGVIGGLPPGISLQSVSPSTIVISGTTKSIGLYKFQLNVYSGRSVQGNFVMYLVVINGFGNSTIDLNYAPMIATEVQSDITSWSYITTFPLYTGLPDNRIYFLIASQTSGTKNAVSSEQGFNSGTNTNELVLQWTNIPTTVSVKLLAMDTQYRALLMEQQITGIKKF